MDNYLVTSALMSHALTKTLRVDHVVESSRIWLAKNMMSASWLDRLMLGQLALKLLREQLSVSRSMRQSDALTLFTNELTLNYQSSLVRQIWQRCSDALEDIISARILGDEEDPDLVSLVFRIHLACEALLIELHRIKGADDAFLRLSWPRKTSRLVRMGSSRRRTDLQ